jgi:predicted MPP superfamily phosphohydrolase
MRSRLGIAVFIALYASVIAVTHFYFVLKLVLLAEVASPLREIAIAAIAVLGLCLFLRPLADRFASEKLAALLAWPAFLWMGVSFLLLISLLASDLVVSIAGEAAAAIVAPSVTRVLSYRAQAAAVASGGALLSLWGLALALRPPTVRRLALTIPGWPAALNGFRIVQLSDVHIGPLLDRRFAASLATRVNALRPDLVAVTGDLVDGSVERIGAEIEPLGRLASRHGTFFVTGNHDYFSRAEPWVERIRSLGWRVLRNERVTIGDGNAAFDVAGVDDRFGRYFGAGHGEDLGAALDGRDLARPVVLLAHNPNSFDEAAERGVELQLSGHTHGGQIWPFAYVVRLATPYVAGVFRRGSSLLYVSRGTGFWGPPMRLFHPAEITEITLQCAAV